MAKALSLSRLFISSDHCGAKKGHYSEFLGQDRFPSLKLHNIGVKFGESFNQILLCLSFDERPAVDLRRPDHSSSQRDQEQQRNATK